MSPLEWNSAKAEERRTVKQDCKPEGFENVHEIQIYNIKANFTSFCQNTAKFYDNHIL